jgi:hypothetical protein
MNDILVTGSNAAFLPKKHVVPLAGIEKEFDSSFLVCAREP